MINEEDMSGVLSIAGKGTGSDLLLRVPKAPDHLCAEAQAGYKWMGNLLAQAQRLKKYYLPTLEIFADGYAQWQWAVSEIKRKNAHSPGSGYVQYFANGASNISGAMSVKKAAVDQMLQCCKLFGLDPKSEKDLKATGDPNQTDLLQSLFKELG